MTRAWSILARAAVFVVGAYFTYLATMNIALTTHAVEAAVNRIAPNHVRIEYASAYSLWFMRVHVKNFRVRGTDSSVEWRMTFDKASTTFGVTDFFARRVHMHDSQAEGISIRIRFKIDPKDATPDYVSKLPPIEGLPDPPLKPAVPVPDPDDAHYALWTVALDDVRGRDIREVWVDTIRVQNRGPSTVVGGFFLKPLRVARVAPTTLVATDAEVTAGKHVIATDAFGTLQVYLRTYDMRAVEGAEILHLLDANVRASARTHDIEFANGFFKRSGVVVSGGTGGITAALGIEQGRVVPGSRAEIRADAWTALHGEERVLGSSFVRAYADRDRPRVVATAETFALALHRAKNEIVNAEYVGLAAHSDDVDLAKPIEHWAASVDVPKASIANVATLDAFTDAPFESGSLTASAHGDFEPHGASGRAKMDFSRVALRLEKSSAVATGSADFVVGRYDFDREHASISNARMKLDDVAYQDERGWWANVTTGPFELSMKNNSPSATFTATGQCRDAKMPLALLATPGIVSTLVGRQPFTVSTRATITPHSLDAPDIRVIGNSVEVYAHYRSDARGKNGAGIVMTPLTNVGFEIVRGALSIRPFASHAWYEHTK